MPFRFFATAFLVALVVFAEQLSVPDVRQIPLLQVGLKPYAQGVAIIGFFAIVGPNPTGGYGRKRLWGALVALVLAVVESGFLRSRAKFEGLPEISLLVPYLVAGTVGVTVVAIAITRLG